MKEFVLVTTLLGSITFTACNGKKEITVLKDFEYALKSNDSSALRNCNEEILFWNKKNSSTPSDTYLSKVAGAYSHRFSITGRMQDIFVADSIYKQLIKKDSNRVGTFQALAVNCMTRHEFREASKYITKALTIGDNKSSSLYTLFDISMELGDYEVAKSVISNFENKKAFSYLIREAKVDDQEGRLDLAIEKMEIAYDRIKDTPSLAQWTLSNLGDMYGHAGHIEQAYQSYLTVLKMNPSHDFALKGIAWIALSHDHNTALAKQIASVLLNRKEMPDMHLLLAKIAEAERDSVEKDNQLKLFTQKASDEKYGDMYNKYLALLEAEDFKNPTKAIEIAAIEVNNRPTPQSYDLLAWGYFQKGQVKEAVAVAQQHIEGLTYEPEAIYHLGMIYKDINNEKSQKYLEEALQSSFELGPAITSTIQKNLE